MTQFSREVPASDEAEKGFLGSLLQPTQAPIILSEMGDKVGPQHFYSPGHARIFETIRLMNEAQKPIDLLTLTQQMRDDSTLDIVGGPIALTALFTYVPTAANVAYYLEILRRKFIRREMIRVGTELVRQAYEENEEEKSLLDSAQAAVTSLAMETTDRPTLRHIAEGVYGAVDSLEGAFKNRGKDTMTGIGSGFYGIDRMTAGFKKQQLIFIAARTSEGKSAMAMNIAAHLTAGGGSGASAWAPVPVAFFSMEMSYDELATRYTCAGTKISLQRLRDGKLHKAEIAALPDMVAPLAAAPLYIDDTPNLAITDFKARARRSVVNQQIGCFIIDYLSLMRSPTKRGLENKVIEVGEVTAGLKALAKELNVPVIACAQLNRQPEQRPMAFPKLSDLRESGSIENDADTVILLWRPGKHCDTDAQRLKVAEKLGIAEENDDTQTLANLETYAEAILAKQRNGPVGRVKLRYQGDLTQFQNLASEKMWSNSEEERQEQVEEL